MFALFFGETESSSNGVSISRNEAADYVGRIGIGKILSGTVKVGQPIWRLRKGTDPIRGKVSKVFANQNQYLDD